MATSTRLACPTPPVEPSYPRRDRQSRRRRQCVGHGRSRVRSRETHRPRGILDIKTAGGCDGAILGRYDLHKGWFGTETLLKSVTCMQGHPLDVIGRGHERGQQLVCIQRLYGIPRKSGTQPADREGRPAGGYRRRFRPPPSGAPTTMGCRCRICRPSRRGSTSPIRRRATLLPAALRCRPRL